jgi:hypothetical protein
MMTRTMGEKMTASSFSRSAIVCSITFPAEAAFWPAADIRSSALSPGGVAWRGSRKRRDQVLEGECGKEKPFQQRTFIFLRPRFERPSSEGSGQVIFRRRYS